MGTSFFIPYEDRDLIETYLSKIDFKNTEIINLLYDGSFQVFYEKKLGPFSILMYVHPNYRQVNKVLVNFGMQTFLRYNLASGFFDDIKTIREFRLLSKLIGYIKFENKMDDYYGE